MHTYITYIPILGCCGLKWSPEMKFWRNDDIWGGEGGGELEYYYYIIDWYRYNSLGVDVAIKKKSIVKRELITLHKFELKYYFFSLDY